MRALRTSRRACALAVATAAGVFCVAAPAAADVTVDPPSGPQGGGLSVTFHVTNEHPKAAMTRVRLVLPTDTPVAEVYPLSVNDWAPKMTVRELDTPLPGIHGGTPVTQTTSAIIWTAMPGKGIPPGGSADLAVSMGPLPTATQMRFTVQPTYADGSTVPAVSPVGLRLTPAGGAGEPAHPGHEAGGAQAGEPRPGDEQAGDLAAGPAETGSGAMAVAGWIVASILAVAGGVAVLRTRRAARTPGAAHPAGAALPAGAAAGDTAAAGGGTGSARRARVTAWSYRDGP